MAQSQIIFFAIIIVSLVAALGMFLVVFTNPSANLELNLVNEIGTNSGIVVRYEIDNHLSSSWTCDPGKFMILFSDGSDHPGISEVPDKMVIEGKGTGSGLLFSSYHPSGVTVVGLIYDDGVTKLRTT